MTDIMKLNTRRMQKNALTVEECKAKRKKRLNSLKRVVMYAMMAVLIGVQQAMAGANLKGQIGTGKETTLISSIIENVITMFPAIGVVIALVGAFKLFMAFRNDQPDSYSNAVKDIVIGAILIIFKTLIWD